MNDSYIYPCLVHLIKIIDQRERPLTYNKPFYHANLLVKHFSEAKELFNPKNSVFKALLTYYRENLLSRL